MIKKIVVSVLTTLLLSFCTLSAQTQNAKKVVSRERANVKVENVPQKKDGTPDMRYKQNKAGAKPAKHLKKDGTPDKRFSANK